MRTCGSENRARPRLQTWWTKGPACCLAVRRVSRQTRAGALAFPKALLTHSLHPLFSTFFSGLGIETVLSGVDPQGELKSNAGFCFPVQIAHGAVLDLARQGVNLIFLPQVMHMPEPNAGGDCYLCPITQASPSFMAKAFPDLQFLSPLLDFSKGYDVSAAMVEMAVRELGMSRELAGSAWTAAVQRPGGGGTRAAGTRPEDARRGGGTTGNWRFSWPVTATAPLRRKPPNPWPKSSPAWE